MVTETKKIVDEGDAKQGRKGVHVFTILTTSLGLAAVAAVITYAVVWS